MPNVIRPTFGFKRPPDDEPPVEVVGQVAGYVVGIVREGGAQNPMVWVVIGKVGGHTLEAVALATDDPVNEDEILNCAIAALRTLEVVTQDAAPDGD